MANEEILGGLRNALERGQSLEKAVQSFINAGYNPNEVKEAASRITKGASTMMQSSQPSPPKKSNQSEQMDNKTILKKSAEKTTPFQSQQSGQESSQSTEEGSFPQQPYFEKATFWNKIKNFISPVKMETRNWIILGVIVILLLIIVGLVFVTIFSEQLLKTLV